MKCFLAVCICVCFLPYISGCQNHKSTEAPFPKSLAGTWKTLQSADVPQFTIVISPDGTLSSAVVPRMDPVIRPNQTTKIELVGEGNTAIFTAGDCPIDYDPATGELSVVLDIEHFRIRIEDIVDEGYMKDIFSGKVSNDGKSWTAEWIELFDYGPGLGQDPNDAYQGTLTFEKISDWKDEK